MESFSRVLQGGNLHIVTIDQQGNRQDVLKQAERTVNVKKKFHGALIGKDGRQVEEIQKKYGVLLCIPQRQSSRCDIKVIGEIHDVERAESEILELVEKLEHRNAKRIGLNSRFPKSQKKEIPVNLPLALALQRYKNIAILSNLKRKISDTVTVTFESSIPALVLWGDGDDLIKAHVKFAEELQKYNDFCVLDGVIADSEMGRFIGKDGRNIKRLESSCDELEIKICRTTREISRNVAPFSIESNITLLGCQDIVGTAFSQLQCQHGAHEIHHYSNDPTSFVLLQESGYQKNDCFSDYGSMISEEDIEECVPVNLVQAKVTFLERWPENVAIMRFIRNSETHSERLKNLFPNESVLLRESTVSIAGQTNDSVSSWHDNINDKLDNYFGGFNSREVKCHGGTSFDIEETDLVVKWDITQSVALVCGVRERVDKKVEELERIKNQQLSLSAPSRIKQLIASMRQNLKMNEFVTFVDHAFFLATLRENEASFPSDIPKKSTTTFSVEVVKDDIVDADVDVIVNTTDKYFSFDGPLSQYIFNRAGNHIRKEITIADKEIRTSGSGNLKCREIFHVAIPQPDESMEVLVLKILKLADERGFVSIAFPAIGAGRGGWKVEAISMSLQSAFDKFKKENNNIKLIMVVLSPLMSCDERVSFHENIKIQNKQPGPLTLLADSMAQEYFMQLLTSWRSRAASTSKSDVVEEEGVGLTNGNHSAMVIVSAESDERLSTAISDIQDLVQRGIKGNKLSVSILKLDPSVTAEAENISYDNVSIVVNGNECASSGSIPVKAGLTCYAATKLHEIFKETSTDAFMDVQNVVDFSKMTLDSNGTTFKSFCEKTSPLVWEEIRFAHKPLKKPTMQMISTAVDCSSGVDELELRDCAPSAELLQLLCNDTERKCEISEFSVTGEDDISMLVSVICKIMRDRGGKALGLSENNLTDEAITLLKDCLRKIRVPSLSSLDISNNEEISNYATLAEVLNTSRMSELRILNCAIIPKRLQQLGRHLAEKLERLDMSFNAEMVTECFSHIGDLLQEHAEFLGLSECDVTEAKALALFQSLERLQIKLNVLDLSYNNDLRYGGVSVISRLVPKCQLTELSMAGCNLDVDCIVVLRRNLSGHKLTKLDLSDNAPMHDQSMKNLGQMTGDCPIENLDLSNCAVSSKQIGIFSDSLGKSKISKLDISDGQLTLDSYMVEAIKSVALKVVDELTLCYENINEFIPVLESVNKNLQIVYGYCNHRREVEHITFLPKVKLKKKLIE